MDTAGRIRSKWLAHRRQVTTDRAHSTSIFRLLKAEADAARWRSAPGFQELPPTVFHAPAAEPPKTTCRLAGRLAGYKRPPAARHCLPKTYKHTPPNRAASDQRAHRASSPRPAIEA